MNLNKPLLLTVFYLSCISSLFFVACHCVQQPIEGVDKIYLISLGHRPDRLAASQNALAQYGVSPGWFPAVDGRKLPIETLLSIALPCTGDVCQQRWVTTPSKDGELSYALLNKGAPLQPVFCEWMTIGAVKAIQSFVSTPV